MTTPWLDSRSVTLLACTLMILATPPPVANADVAPVQPQDLVLQDYRSEANARWRFTLGNSVTQVEQHTAGIFGEAQNIYTAWSSDLTVRYNPTEQLQLLAFSSTTQSRRRITSPFAREVQEQSRELTHGSLGIRWDLPRTWRLGAASVQLGYRLPFADDGAAAVSVAYSMVSLLDPLLMYGRLGYSQMVEDPAASRAVQSRTLWRVTMGGAFVVNYATSIGAAVTVTYRSAEEFERVRLNSDTEARLRLSVNRLLSRRLSVEPYFDFRLDRTTGSFSGGINLSFSI